MPVLTALPSQEIINGLKGVLDFYVWRGLPCVRTWPRYSPANVTPASQASADTFGAIVKAYALLDSSALSDYFNMAQGVPRTPRDVMVSGVLGHLHEQA